MTARNRGWFTSEAQRKPVAHGTRNGAVQREPACERCLPARRAYNRAHPGAPRQPAPPLALSRARELRDLVQAGTAQQAAWATGRSQRTIWRWRKLLRGAA